jgi:CheY-like chemotaxis protein
VSSVLAPRKSARPVRKIQRRPACPQSAGGEGERARLRPAPDPAAHATSHSARRLPGTATRRVLVVDDEPSIRLLCRVNLQGEGMDVLEASDGERALELARQEQPDLVLLDVMMPELDGWTVAGKLQDDEETRAIPIVFLTALAERSSRAQGHQLGGVAYIVKPFDPVALAPFVGELLARLERGDREALRREMLEG